MFKEVVVTVETYFQWGLRTPSSLLDAELLNNCEILHFQQTVVHCIVFVRFLSCL